MHVLKRREFARWQRKVGLLDVALCEAAREMDCGLVDAHLGGLLFKKRVGRPGGGKRGGHRTLVAARAGTRCVFLLGFAKNERANVTLEEQAALRMAGRVMLDLSGDAFDGH